MAEICKAAPDLQRRCVEVYRETRDIDKTCAALGVHAMTVWRALKFSQSSLDAGTIMRLSGRDSSIHSGVAAEQAFMGLVPKAESANGLGMNNPGFDFMLAGWRIEVKFSSLQRRGNAPKWQVVLSRPEQKGDAVSRTDFFVVFLCASKEFSLSTARIFIVPAELIGAARSMTINESGTTEWMRFEVPQNQVADFFAGLPDKAAFEAATANPDQALSDFQRRANEKTVSLDDRNLIVALSAEGLDDDEIAAKFGVRPQFVAGVLRDSDASIQRSAKNG